MTEDFMQTSGLDFEVEEYDSDLESVISNEEDNVVLDDWIASANSFSDFEIRQYTLRDDYRDEVSPGSLVNAIYSAYRSMRCITAVRLLADIHDLDNEEDIRWSQKIRFEISNFESGSELREQILNYIVKNEAPIWHRLLTDETSDKGYRKRIKYHMNYFDFCIQTPTKTKSQVTTVCGKEEIHPGIFVRMITDHGNIRYRKNDCLIKCLNEVLNMREQPNEIRREIWEDDKKIDRDIHTPRHIKHICIRYDVRLVLSDVLLQKNTIFNREGSKEVKLVKVGKVLGLLDRVDHSVDKRNSKMDVAYYDLETVGPDQRVYAFTWRHHSGDMVMCHNNFDTVERALTVKVLDTARAMEDNSTLIVYAWNGCRFDNWITFKLLKKEFNKKLWIRDIIINSGNELLSFKLTYRDAGRKNPVHVIFKDPKKMFNVSIPEACKVFNINEGKHKYDHDEVDRAYMDGRFDKYIEKNKERIWDYVEQDGILLEKITGCITELYAREDINMYNVLTRSVASSISWQKTIEHHKILKDVTLSPYTEICGTHSKGVCPRYAVTTNSGSPEGNRGKASGCSGCRVRYNDIMDHAIGGRTQCVQRGTFSGVCGIDVNSMYPYVCANREYPCGDIVEWLPKCKKDCTAVECPRCRESKPPADKLGVYLVRIKKQSNPHVIPYRRSKHYAYNWEYKGEFEKWITSVDIEQLDNYEVLKGFYWTDKTDKFYKNFMIDNYNERVSIEKSDPRNMHIKLKMNGVTGSVFQHSFRELIMIFEKEKFSETIKKYSELVTVIGCDLLNEREYIVTMRPVKLKEGDPRIKAQREFCKGAITQKPWVLTMFTYSYARKVLRDEWIKLEQKGCKVIYCDTDSLFFTGSTSPCPTPTCASAGRVSECEHSRPACKCCGTIVCKKEYIHKDKDLGKWSIEYWNDEGSFYTPKVYAIKNIGKLRIKGVGYNSLVTDTELKNADLNYDQKLKLYLDTAATNVHPSYRHVKDLVDGKPLKTINFVMEKSSQHGIQKKYEIKIIR